jgi:hypothetical protein
MAKDPDDGKNWSRKTEAKGASELAALFTEGLSRASWRHDMAARGAAVYSSVYGGNLFDSLPFDRAVNKPGAKRYGKHKLNHGRAIVQTMTAKIAGLDEPKSQQVTSDAPWEERRQAVWQDRFTEGNFHEQQGLYQNIWDLARHGFTLSGASTGTVGIRVEPDFVFKRVSHQLRSTLNTWIDPHDRANGRPLTTVDVTWENPEVMVEDPRWAKHKDHIWKSAKPVPVHMQAAEEVDFGTKLVQVVTAWRLPFGSFKGREARIVGGKAIQWDDYEQAQPRIAFFRMARCLGDDFWSENLIESVLWALDTANDVVEMTNRTMRLLSSVMLAFDKRATKKSDLANAKDVLLYGYDGAKGGPPTAILPPILDASRGAFKDELIRAAHEILGVDQMHSAAQRPEGITSGRGVRMVAALFSERHSPIQRAWRHWIAVDTAELNVAAAREIGQHDPDWQVTWPGQDFDAKVSVKVLDALRDRKYSRRAYVVSEQKNTPADRIALINEWVEAGQLTPEAGQMLMTETLDTPSETKAQSVQKRFFAKLVDQALHAEEDELRDPNFWAAKYQSPPPWIEPAIAMKQVFEAYLEAMIDDVPQFRRNILKRTLEELDWMMASAARQEAMLSNARMNVNVDSTMGEALPVMSQPPALPMPGAPSDIANQPIAAGPGGPGIAAAPPLAAVA